MACTLKEPCGGLLREDRTFAREVAAVGVRRRKLDCVAGHSHYDPPYAPPAPKDPPVFRPGPPQRHQRYRRINRERAVALYARGWSGPKIARHLGCAVSTAYYALRRLRVRRRRSSPTITCVEPRCRVSVAKRRRHTGMMVGTRCARHATLWWRALWRHQKRAQRARHPRHGRRVA